METKRVPIAEIDRKACELSEQYRIEFLIAKILLLDGFQMGADTARAIVEQAIPSLAG